MKRRFFVFLIPLLLIAEVALAQQGSLEIGGSGSLLYPVGSLAYRFRPTIGAALQVRWPATMQPIWGGAIEYFVFDQENTDNLVLHRPVEDAGVEKNFTIPLPLLTMKLEVIGISANAGFGFLTIGPVEADVDVGFGVYRWTFTRSGYYDTLKVATTAGPSVAEVLRVPQIRQQDWSGGFHAGVEISAPLVNPVRMHVGARYKVIVGELWPTLALDLDNVSTLRMIELRIGLSATL